jgi:hypothetical protein
MTDEDEEKERVKEHDRRVQEEYWWFSANRDSIIKGHHNEWVVLRDHKVLGYFPNTNELFTYMDKSGAPYGSYTVQPCLTLDEEINCYSFLSLHNGSTAVSNEGSCE